MKTVRAALEKSVGQYVGEGLNHEGQKFKGTFAIEPTLGGRGFRVSFLANGVDGTVYHQEDSLIAPSLREECTLWNFNTNTPGLVPHELSASEETPEFTRFVFSFGVPSDKNSFRDAVALTLWKDSHASYVYSWGLPGGEFAERSGAKMERI